MRLLYVIDSLAPGGAETSLVEMAPGLVSGGIELHVMPLGVRVDLAHSLEAAGAIVHTRSRPSGRLVNVRAVMSVAQRVLPDLIHTTLFEADIAGRIAARVVGSPSSSSLVNDSYSAAHYNEARTAKLHTARAIDAVTARSASRFHAISAAIASRVPPRIGVDPALVDVIPRGRDPHKYQFRSAALRTTTREGLGISEHTPVILAIGRLDPQKGLDHLIRALTEVTFKHPSAVTLIAGKDGRAAADLRKAADAARVDVRFLGHRMDVPALLAAADVFCFPSEREGFGGVLIEALAVGCPVVASAIPTSQEVLGRGGSSTGILVPPGNDDRLGHALAAILASPAESAARARDGRERFEDLFTVDKVVAQMISFFEAAKESGRRYGSLHP